MLRYALAIFVSAFLLFQVQPLTGRFILPWFGGGPSIWTACMLFFQLVLLAGYLYSHLLTTFLSPRRQAIVHLTLLVLSLACLPIIPSDSWKPSPEASPLKQILLLLSVTVGVPYFLLSTTGPLMQRWFTRAVPGGSPWRLYALSNVGSLLALTSYPFVFEPWLKLKTQAFSWSVLYSLYAGLATLCAMALLKAPATESAAPLPNPANEPARGPALEAHIPWPRLTVMLLWLLLSASASVMLLATTNQLCIDVATVPFLWILPLALYLISFILCFDSPRWYDRRIYSLILLLLSPFACQLLSEGPDADISLQLVFFPTILFACCMMCHGELYQLRPQPRWLTLYFVIVSAGGALGGVFVAILAPEIFHGYWEYHVGLLCCCIAGTAAMILQKVWLHPVSLLFSLRLAASLLQLAALAIWFFTPVWENLTDTTDTLLKTGCGLILLASLQLTSLLESRTRTVFACWVLLALGQILLLMLTVQRHAPGIVNTTLWSSCLAAVLLPEVAAIAAALALKKFSRNTAQLSLIATLAAAAALLLAAFHHLEILSTPRLQSIAITAVAGILMDLAARGFRGPAKPLLGLSLIVPALTLLMILGLRLTEVAQEETADQDIVAISRNFYGVLRVRHEESDGTLDLFQNPFPSYYSLKHGQISHGVQYQDDYWSKLPTTYYGEESGFAIAVRIAREHANQTNSGKLRVGTIGLGTGTIAAFGQPNEYFCFYDINPDVFALSSNKIFTYLKDSKATIDFKLGDARIVLEKDLRDGVRQQFDVLAVDAFSSDAIPVHLLTAECAEIYKQHLRPGGILAVHISNRFLNLEPVARGMAEQLGWNAFLVDNPNDDAQGVFASSWVLITSSQDVAEDPELALAVDPWTKDNWILKWTDDYSGLWQVLQF
jgi:hypothetical protein